MKILGVDPGLAKCGLALFDCGSWSTWTIRTECGPLAPRVEKICKDVRYLYLKVVDLIIIEHQRKYSGEDDKKTAALLDIAVVEGALLATVPHYQSMLVVPAVWKGQVPKYVHHKRIRAQVPSLGRCSMDALDAVGLVLYAQQVFR